MELFRHRFPNWFVWLLIIALIATVVIRNFREMERKNRERSEAIDKENERREATKQSCEVDKRKRAEVRRLHKLGWRTADIAHQLKISTDLVRLHVRSEDNMEISMIGAIAAMRELRKTAQTGEFIAGDLRIATGIASIAAL